MAASRIFVMISSGTGSGLSRRSARAEYIASNNPISLMTTDNLPLNGRKSRAITSIDALKPLKLPWYESKLPLRLLVRSTAQLQCVVNDIRTTGLNGRFVTYVGWWRCFNKIGKCRQPASQRNGIVVDDVVHAWAYFQGRNRCRGGIFDVNK